MCVKIVSLLFHEIGVEVKDWSVIKMGGLFNQFCICICICTCIFIFIFIWVKLKDWSVVEVGGFCHQLGRWKASVLAATLAKLSVLLRQVLQL